MRRLECVSLTDEQVNIVAHYEGLRGGLQSLEVQLTVILPVPQRDQWCFLRSDGAPFFAPRVQYPLLGKTLEFGVRTCRNCRLPEGLAGELFLPLRDSCGRRFGILALRRFLHLPLFAADAVKDGRIRAFRIWLEERQQVQTAKQKIMERFGLDEATAYQILQKEAMNKRCSLAAVARVIV